MPARPLDPDNRLFALARTGRLRWLVALPPEQAARLDRLYPLLAIAGAVLLPVTAAVLAQAAMMWLDGAGLSDDLREALVLILEFGPVFLLVALWLWLFEGRPLWTIGLERAGWLGRYLRGAAWGLVAMAAAVVLMALAGWVAVEPAAPGRTGPAALGGVLVLFAGWAVQGAAEEAVTRGFLLPVTGIRWGAVAGVGVTSALFAALHLANPNVGPVAVLNVALVGVLLALYAMREGGLWGVCAFHSVWNWAQGNVFGFQVSGTPERWSMLVDLRENGPDALTGGAFGPEGGLIVTAVIVAGIVAVAWRAGPAPNPARAPD
jgi:membrane protease YdiL (CAAX protease family)